MKSEIQEINPLLYFVLYLAQGNTLFTKFLITFVHCVIKKEKQNSGHFQTVLETM